MPDFSPLDEAVEQLMRAHPARVGESPEEHRRRLTAAEEAARRYSEASRSGEPFRRTRIDPGEEYLRLSAPGRDDLVIRPGVVEFRLEGDYDVDVRLGVDQPAGGTPMLTVEEFTLRHRPGGTAIGSRRVQKVPVHEYVARAVEALTMKDGTLPGLPGYQRLRMVDVDPQLRRLLRRPPAQRPGRPTLSDEDLRRVAEVCERHEGRQWKKDAWHDYRQGESILFETFRYRVKKARERTDPDTGRAFLSR